MRALRGWVGWLYCRLFGLGEMVAPGNAQGMYQCLHPQKAWTACTYQLGPYGYWSWYMRCRQCGGWFSC